MSKVNDKRLTIKLSHNPTSGNFFIDFWDGDKYIVSEKINEVHALCLSRDLNIKILIQ